MICSNPPQNTIEKKFWHSPELLAVRRECSGTRKKRRVLRKLEKMRANRKARHHSKNAIYVGKEINQLPPLTKWAIH